MLGRFQGEDGRRRLVEALRSQQFVEGDQTVAAALASAAELREVDAGEAIIEQNGEDDDLYLIIVGTFDIIIHGRKVGTRIAGHHVGELALIDPSVRRSASVVASETSVVARITEPNFTTIAASHPQLWRAFAREIGNRLRARSRHIKPPNARPVIFIGSSGEALAIANAVRDGLVGTDREVRTWKDGIFGASNYPMEDLERQLDESDFAVLVASPDDLAYSRGTAIDSPRDNVVFEFGLFMGALSRNRTFLVVPRQAEIKIPTDLAGLTTLRYSLPAGGGAPIVAEACAAILARVMKDGPR